VPVTFHLPHLPHSTFWHYSLALTTSVLPGRRKEGILYVLCALSHLPATLCREQAATDLPGRPLPACMGLPAACSCLLAYYYLLHCLALMPV